jgi:hypothetical protein
MPVSSTSPLDTLQSAAAATGNGTPTDVTGAQGLVVEVSGTFVGTVTFEGTIDDTSWFVVNMLPVGATQTAVTTATAPGQWTTQHATLALSQFRARVSAYTSGSVTVKARKDYR